MNHSMTFFSFLLIFNIICINAMEQKNYDVVAIIKFVQQMHTTDNEIFEFLNDSDQERAPLAAKIQSTKITLASLQENQSTEQLIPELQSYMRSYKMYENLADQQKISISTYQQQVHRLEELSLLIW